ncbi:MAG: hypothetical protein V4722_24225 [Bacteroidota bacterium]
MTTDINLCELVAGEKDPSTSKPIVYVVHRAKSFLVTIDSDINLNWFTSQQYEEKRFAADFGEVAGSCNMAAALVDRIFVGRKNRLSYKKMLGEVIGRILDDRNSFSAKTLLRKVDERIYEHCKERVRMAYIYAAFATVSLLAILLLIVERFSKEITFFAADSTRYQIVMPTLLGGVGAFITTFFRFRKYSGSVVSGLAIHRLDGFLRVFYGVFAGLMVTFAIKGNVLIGFANENPESQPWLGYFLAMIAGASEILIPNLINQTEENLRFKTQGGKGTVKIKEKAEEPVAGDETTRMETKPTAQDENESEYPEPAVEAPETEPSTEEPTNEVHIKTNFVLEPDVDEFSPAQSKDL